MTMTRQQVLVQLDTELVRRLDELAEAEHTSRSELLRRGAAAVLRTAQERADEQRHAEGYRRQPQGPDELDFAFEAARRALL
jgi:predicted transcriptional regulator